MMFLMLTIFFTKYFETLFLSFAFCFTNKHINSKSMFNHLDFSSKLFQSWNLVENGNWADVFLSKFFRRLNEFDWYHEVYVNVGCTLSVCWVVFCLFARLFVSLFSFCASINICPLDMIHFFLFDPLIVTRYVLSGRTESYSLIFSF